jgi:arylsulfatase A-like enzyme
VEDVLTKYAVDQIHASSKGNKPLFMFYSSHLVHSPLQAPQNILDMFSFITDLQRQHLAAMTYYLDLTVGKIVDALKTYKMWDNTLFLFFADNGGAIYFGGVSLWLALKDTN